MSKPFTIEYVREKFNERGYKLISSEYKNAHHKLSYICLVHEEYGIQTINYNHFQGGQGCIYCGNEALRRKLECSKRVIYYDTVRDFFIHNMPTCSLISTETEFEKSYIEQRKGNGVRVKFVCAQHPTIIQERYFKDLQKRPKCPLCLKEEKQRKYRHEGFIEFKSLANSKGYKVKALETEYINATTNLLCSCSQHGDFKINLGHLQEGKGCRRCGYKKSAEKNRLQYDYVKDKLKEYDLILLSDEYVDNQTPLKLSCPNHLDKTFYIAYSHVVSNKSKCPYCTSMSRGEKEIERILSMNHKVFELHKRFYDLYRYYGKYLSYDFYLPEENVLIEYQGEFHDTVTTYNSPEHLIDQQERDRLKRQYAKDNGYKLIEIWHQDIRNIEQILRDKEVI